MMRASLIFRLALLATLAVALPGCKTVGGWFGGDKEEKTERLEVEQLYAEAHENMLQGDFSIAHKYFSRLIARFPFGPYNEQAQLELAYTQYKIGKPDDATSTIDRFIRTYPRHRHIAYAYYLKSIINFDRNIGIMSRVFRTDPAARDLNGPLTSFNDFNEVLRRYPNSIYAGDARQHGDVRVADRELARPPLRPDVDPRRQRDQRQQSEQQRGLKTHVPKGRSCASSMRGIGTRSRTSSSTRSASTPAASASYVRTIR